MLKNKEPNLLLFEGKKRKFVGINLLVEFFLFVCVFLKQKTFILIQIWIMRVGSWYKNFPLDRFAEIRLLFLPLSNKREPGVNIVLYLHPALSHSITFFNSTTQKMKLPIKELWIFKFLNICRDESWNYVVKIMSINNQINFKELTFYRLHNNPVQQQQLLLLLMLG